MSASCFKNLTEVIDLVQAPVRRAVLPNRRDMLRIVTNPAQPQMPDVSSCPSPKVKGLFTICNPMTIHIVQGGKVTEFVYLPSAHEMGHIRFQGEPASSSMGSFIVSVAPYVFWCCTCLAAFAVSRRQAALGFVSTSIVFVWMFLIPFADITNAVLSYYFGNPINDFRSAFGWPPPVTLSIVCVAAGAGLAFLGFLTQQRLYRERALGVTSYTILGVGSFLLLVGMKVMRLWIMRNN